MTTVYVIMRRGIWHGSVVGVFDDFAAACDHARRAIVAEQDDYHRMTVEPYELGALLLTPYESQPHQPDPLLSLYRIGTRVYEFHEPPRMNRPAGRIPSYKWDFVRWLEEQPR